MRCVMNIFGFTITKTSKKKLEEKELEIFEKCLDCMDKATTVAKHTILSEPSILTVQDLAALQENIEGLVEIYNQNRFSKPAPMFTLSKLLQDLRTAYVNYTTATSKHTHVLNELKKLENTSEYEMFGGIFNSHYKKANEQMYKQCVADLNSCIKDYLIALNSIRYTITYDLTRFATGVDIIKQYHETKGYTVPETGTEFKVCFKKLSRDEINEQTKSNKEREDK